MPFTTLFAGNSASALGFNISKKPLSPQLSLVSRTLNELQYLIANYDSLETEYFISGTNAVIDNETITQSLLSPETEYSLNIYVVKNGFASDTTSISNYTSTIAPIFALSGKTSSSLIWSISNYDTSVSASYGFNGSGSISQLNDIVTQSDLLPNTQYSISGTKIKNSISSELSTSSLEYTEE